MTALVLIIPIVVLIAATPTALDASETAPWLKWTVLVARWPMALLLFALLLSGLYWIAPAERQPFQLMSPGVMVAGLLFLFGSIGFSLYASNVDRYDRSYGSLATIVVTMLWVYVSSSAVLVGAEVDALRASDQRAGESHAEVDVDS